MTKRHSIFSTTRLETEPITINSKDGLPSRTCFESPVRGGIFKVGFYDLEHHHHPQPQRLTEYPCLQTCYQNISVQTADSSQKNGDVIIASENKTFASKHRNNLLQYCFDFSVRLAVSAERTRAPKTTYSELNNHNFMLTSNFT